MIKSLYPPYIDGTIPAFYKTYLTENIAEGATIVVPFSMNKSVGSSLITGFVLRVKTVSTGTYILSPVYSNDFSLVDYTVSFTLDSSQADKFQEGLFYKLQIAYYYGTLDAEHTGYFSTVGIIKCITKPTVYIRNLNDDSINALTNEFCGVYEIDEDRNCTEKVYSYSFNFYNEDEELCYTTGEQLHDTSLDVDYYYSEDTLRINDFMEDNATYVVQYVVTTMNGLELKSSKYKITSESLLAPTRNLEIIATSNNDNGYMSITFKGEDEEYIGTVDGVETTLTKEANYFGLFVLMRACEDDDYSSWIEIDRFRLDNAKPSSVVLKDYTVALGISYIYALLQYNIHGLYSDKIKSSKVSADFEDIYLYDGDRLLKVRFNPKVSTFKTDLLDTKIDTVGSKYPFIFRNGKVEYKEFPIGGLISFLMDDELLFYNRTVLPQVPRHNLVNYRNYDPYFWNVVDPTENNFKEERKFKLEVLDWLNNGKPKLFRSPAEGNYIVRLMNTSLTPEDTLGRMIHNFTTTAYEIAEFNYDNLLKYGFINILEPEDYLPLWKTINFEDYNVGEEIEIDFDKEIISFCVHDMFPGDKIQIKYKDSDDPETIIIGVTGSYYYEDNDRDVESLIIPNDGTQKIIGSIDLHYKGLRLNIFDAVTGVLLKTIVGKQYVGVDPMLLAVKKDPGQVGLVILDTECYDALINLAFRDFLVNLVVKSENNGKILGYKVTQEFVDKIKNEFEPGDLILQISSTIYGGEWNKVELINLELAHFRLRELIPIYYMNKENEFYVTPFGQPYPIDDIWQGFRYEKYQYVDKYCIYDALKYNETNQEWEHYFYYDAFYGKKIDNYDTTFYINDHLVYEYIDVNDIVPNLLSANKNNIIIDENNNLIYDYAEEDDNGILWYYQKAYEQIKDGYVYNAYGDVVYNKFYIEDELVNYIAYWHDEIGYLNTYDNFNNKNLEVKERTFYKYGNNYVYFDEINFKRKNSTTGQYIDITESSNTPDFSTYDKYYFECADAIDLSVIKEKHFSNLGLIDKLVIGTGVIAELTMQLKVLDFYTETLEKNVSAAKENYIELSTLLNNLMRDYESIEESDLLLNRYDVLRKCYEHMICGYEDKSLSDLTDDQREILSNLLSNKDILNTLNLIYDDDDNTKSSELDELKLLIKENTKLEGIANKLNALKSVKLTLQELLETLTEEQQNLQEEYSELVSAKETAVSNYKQDFCGYYAANYLINNLIDEVLNYKESMDRPTDKYSEEDWEKVNAIDIILAHYQEVSGLIDLSEDIDSSLTDSSYLSQFNNIYSSAKQYLSNVKTHNTIIEDNEDDEELDNFLEEKILSNYINFALSIYLLYLILNILENTSSFYSEGELYEVKYEDYINNFSSLYSDIMVFLNNLSDTRMNNLYNNIKDYYTDLKSTTTGLIAEVKSSDDLTSEIDNIYTIILNYDILSKLKGCFEKNTSTNKKPVISSIIESSNIYNISDIETNVNTFLSNMTSEQKAELNNSRSIVENKVGQETGDKLIIAGDIVPSSLFSDSLLDYNQNSVLKIELQNYTMLKLISILKSELNNINNGSYNDFSEVVPKMNEIYFADGTGLYSMQVLIDDIFGEDGLNDSIITLDNFIYDLLLENSLNEVRAKQSAIIEKEETTLTAIDLRKYNELKPTYQFLLSEYEEDNKIDLDTLIINNNLYPYLDIYPINNFTVSGTLKTILAETSKTISCNIMTSTTDSGSFSGTISDLIYMSFNSNILNLLDEMVSWYIDYVLGYNVEYYETLYELAEVLQDSYDYRLDNYLDKFDKYEELKEYYQAIYDSYANTEQMTFYTSEGDQNEKFDEYIKKVQKAWNDFVVVLDEEFTDEMERGLYK